MEASQAPAGRSAPESLGRRLGIEALAQRADELVVIREGQDDIVINDFFNPQDGSVNPAWANSDYAWLWWWDTSLPRYVGDTSTAAEKDPAYFIGQGSPVTAETASDADSLASWFSPTPIVSLGLLTAAGLVLSASDEDASASDAAFDSLLEPVSRENPQSDYSALYDQHLSTNKPSASPDESKGPSDELSADRVDVELAPEDELKPDVIEQDGSSSGSAIKDVTFEEAFEQRFSDTTDGSETTPDSEPETDDSQRSSQDTASEADTEQQMPLDQEVSEADKEEIDKEDEAGRQDEAGASPETPVDSTTDTPEERPTVESDALAERYFNHFQDTAHRDLTVLLQEEDSRIVVEYSAASDGALRQLELERQADGGWALSGPEPALNGVSLQDGVLALNRMLVEDASRLKLSAFSNDAEPARVLEAEVNAAYRPSTPAVIHSSPEALVISIDHLEDFDTYWAQQETIDAVSTADSGAEFYLANPAAFENRYFVFVGNPVFNDYQESHSIEVLADFFADNPRATQAVEVAHEYKFINEAFDFDYYLPEYFKELSDPVITKVTEDSIHGVADPGVQVLLEDTEGNPLSVFTYADSQGNWTLQADTFWDYALPNVRPDEFEGYVTTKDMKAGQSSRVEVAPPEPLREFLVDSGAPDEALSRLAAQEGEYQGKLFLGMEKLKSSEYPEETPLTDIDAVTLTELVSSSGLVSFDSDDALFSELGLGFSDQSAPDQEVNPLTDTFTLQELGINTIEIANLPVQDGELEWDGVSITLGNDQGESYQLDLAQVLSEDAFVEDNLNTVGVI